METLKDVLSGSSPVDSEVLKTPEAVDAGSEDGLQQPPVEQKPPKGYVPYQALDEERRKRKELEQKISDLESSSVPSNDDLSDEGRTLKKELGSLRDDLRSLKEEKELEKLTS